jgi:hypothetical protein
MKTLFWGIGVAVAGAFLAIKDVDWLYDSVSARALKFAIYSATGFAMGVCISLATSPPKPRQSLLLRAVWWSLLFAILGLALGHGNVPVSTTVRFIVISTVVGLAIGLVQYSLARRRINSAGSPPAPRS